MQNLFGEHFEVSHLDYAKFVKCLSKFKQYNKKWSKDNSKEQQEYYSFFSPSNWRKLTDKYKNKLVIFSLLSP